MVNPNVSLTAPASAGSSIPGSATQAVTPSSEGPASAPTILIELEDSGGMPTALPAPPLLPSLSAAEGWPGQPPSRLRGTSPALVVVEAPKRFSRRPTVRVPETRSQKLLCVARPSTPPTAPPPGARALRRAA